MSLFTEIENWPVLMQNQRKGLSDSYDKGFTLVVICNLIDDLTVASLFCTQQIFSLKKVQQSDASK